MRFPFFALLCVVLLSGIYSQEFSTPKKNEAVRPSRTIEVSAVATMKLEQILAAQQVKLEQLFYDKEVPDEKEYQHRGAKVPGSPLFMPKFAKQQANSDRRNHHVVAQFDALQSGPSNYPPDTHGAVGPNHLVTALNTQVCIQKKDGTVLCKTSLNDFFMAIPGIHFDPRIVYDHLSQRWIITDDVDPLAATARISFAISRTSDPTGLWDFYEFAADTQNSPKKNWADYCSLGVNNTFIAICNSLFTIAEYQYVGVKMWVIDKASALDEATNPGITVSVFEPGFTHQQGVDSYHLTPAVTYDTEQNTLFCIDNNGLFTKDDVNLLRLSQITGSGGSPVWQPIAGGPFPGSGLLAVAHDFHNSYSFPATPQKGSQYLIDTNDMSICSDVCYRNGRLWVAHNGGLPRHQSIDRVAVFWYEIDPPKLTSKGNPIVQSGVIDEGPGVFLTFPSIAVNKRGDVCVAFSRASKDIYIGAAFSSRLSTDPPGQMGAMQIIKSGEHPFENMFGLSVRWGDYSATVVDPTNDDIFWTIQEYADEAVKSGKGKDTRWATRWAKIK